MAEKLKIIPLGGLDEIGKNITVLEYGKDMIVVDCGVGFPEEDMYGVDLVIPDFSYLVENQKKLRGFFITHGHEDHIGSIPYAMRQVNCPIHGTAMTNPDFSYLVENQKKLRGFFITHGHEDHIGSIPYAMRQVNCPIHGTAMTNGLIKLKLEEHKLADKVKLVTHKPGDVVKAGCFSVEFIHVNHSIADAVAFAIRTPVGTVVFTGDFKIDPTAKDGMMNLARLGELGNQGVLALLADSTNVERQGYTPSENLVADSLDRQFKHCDQRIIVTTFASNMHRIQSIIATAQRYGRKVAVTGRSMENMLKVAQELGYLSVKQGTIVDINAIKSLPKNKIVIVSTGSQGENMSALYRMAFGTHKQVDITAGDRIMISASAIPGNEKSVSKIINELYIVTTFASNMHRIQSIIATAQRYGRKVAVTGRSMENMLKVAQELGYLSVKQGTIVDINAIKSLPKNKIVIVSTGSQGENMSALYRMAFGTHQQVDITAGDRIMISASAIPGNEKSVSKIINELYRKGADVVYEKSEGLHVSGHACQEELKIVHGLVKPRFFLPVHGEQRHLQIHSRLAQSMGMNPRNIHIGTIGTVFERLPGGAEDRPRSCKASVLPACPR